LDCFASSRRTRLLRWPRPGLRPRNGAALRPGEVGDADAARICARLASYRAWYDELLEDAEVEGRRRRHRLSIHGTLVGASVAASPFVDLLSLHGREVAFWTYRLGEGSAEFEPHYREERSSPPSPLGAMLDHLPWEGPADRLRAPGGESSNLPILPTTG